jgi:hypothetical protein
MLSTFVPKFSLLLAVHYHHKYGSTSQRKSHMVWNVFASNIISVHMFSICISKYFLLESKLKLAKVFLGKQTFLSLLALLLHD